MFVENAKQIHFLPSVLFSSKKCYDQGTGTDTSTGVVHQLYSCDNVPATNPPATNPPNTSPPATNPPATNPLVIQENSYGRFMLHTFAQKYFSIFRH